MRAQTGTIRAEPAASRHAQPGPPAESDTGMRHEIGRGNGAEFAVFRTGMATSSGPLLVCAHGWGQTHEALLPLARSMARAAAPVLVDLPGFGHSPPPPAAWGNAEYADAMAEWLTAMPRPRVWVGHSFGCRIALALAARHPEAVDAMFLVAAAGLPPHRSPARRARIALRRWAYRALRGLAPEGPARERLRERFGSADYRAAGAMRPTFVRVVSEDLTDAARAVHCPVELVYGERDTETPPEIGARLQALIPGARLSVLQGLDHWTVLTEGQHQLAFRLAEFLKCLS